MHTLLQRKDISLTRVFHQQNLEAGHKYVENCNSKGFCGGLQQVAQFDS